MIRDEVAFQDLTVPVPGQLAKHFPKVLTQLLIELLAPTPDQISCL